MLKKWNRVLAGILSVALVSTTFGGDLASATAYAAEAGEVIEETAEGNGEPHIDSSIPSAEEASLDDLDLDEDEDTQEDAAEASTEEASGEEADASGEQSEDEAAAENIATENTATEETPAVDENGNPVAEPVDGDVAAEETEESKADEKLVTVKYKSQKGGTVSLKSETIDINDEDASFAGSTAAAWNEEYTFLGWVDEEGVVVEEDETIVPSDITEDAVFTATFEASEDIDVDMPSIGATDVHKGGLIVSVDAEEGVFPAGTTLSITGISESDALSTAQDELGEQVTAAKGVDITFWYNGQEIQPADETYVHVTLALEETIAPENLTVLHDHGDEVEAIDVDVTKDDEGNAEAVEFDVEEFSVFIVAEQDSSSQNTKKVATYNFYSRIGDETPVNTQYITSGDTLENPGSPEDLDSSKREVFNGWYELNADKTGFKDTPVTFGVISEVQNDVVIDVYANITTTYYLTFVGDHKDRVKVKEVRATDGLEAKETLYDVQYAVSSATQAFKGWSTVEDSEDDIIPKDVNEITLTDNATVYAIVYDAYYIRFDENDDVYDDNGNKISSGGATYTAPIAVKKGTAPGEKAKPADPTQKGYVFEGWYEGTKNSKNQVVFGNKFDWTKTRTEDVTVYAKWAPSEKTNYTVVIWKQKVTDDVNATTKTYEYAVSENYTAATGAAINVSSNNKKPVVKVANKNQTIPSTDLTGFSFEKIDLNGGTATSGNISAKGDTIVNIYYTRNKHTLTFQVDKGWWTIIGWHTEWTTVKSITALYGQDISSNFPIVGTDGKKYEYNWQPYNSKTFDVVLVIIDSMPDEDITFYGQGNTRYTQTMNFYTQTIDDVKGDEQYKNKQFDLINTVKAHYNFVTYEEDFIELKGFTRLGSNPEFYNYYGTKLALYEETGTINFYYTRNKYDLFFMDGKNQIGKISGIPYEKSLSTYEAQAPATAEKPGYTFVGWFQDPEGTQKFDWSITMPDENKQVYAVYAPVHYRVNLNPGEGFIDKDKKSATINEEYGQVISSQSISDRVFCVIDDEEWELVGWYYEGTDIAYEFDKITGGTPQYDEEKKEWYVDINIEARWRYPGLVKVVYDVKDGSDKPTEDEYSYAYGSNAVVARACTAPEGYRFIGWTIKGDNSGKIYYPDNCVVVNKKYVTDGKMTLVAYYEKLGTGSTETTTISFHSNYGTDEKKDFTKSKNEPFEALSNTAFTRNHYTLLGWSRTSGDKNTVDFECGATIAADNEEPVPNDLYAVWQKNTMTYTVKYYYGESVDPEKYLGESSEQEYDPEVYERDKTINIGNGTADGCLDFKLASAGAGYSSGEKISVEEISDGTYVVTVLYKPISVTITVTTQQVSTTYDGQPHTAQYSVSCPNIAGFDASKVLYDGKSQAESGTTVTLTNAGSKSVTLDASKFSYVNGGYKVSFVFADGKNTNSVTIDRKPVAITVDDKSKKFGDKDPELTATVGKTVDNETLVYTLKRTNDAEAVGTYDDVLDAEYDENNAVNKNYNITVNKGTFTITKADADDMELTPHPYEGTYDAKDHEGYATVNAEATAAGVKIEYSKDGKDWTETRPTIKDAGSETYQVRATSDSYETKTCTVTLTVKKADVAITVDDKSKKFGDKDPELTATVGKTVDNETLVYTLKRTNDTEAVGTYDDVLAAEYDENNAVNKNYNITVNKGTFTITKADADGLGLTAEGFDVEYNGEAHEVTASATVTEGTSISFKVGDGEWTTTVPKYTDVLNKTKVTVKAENPNYKDKEITVEIQITKKPITLHVDDAEKNLGETDPDFKLVEADLKQVVEGDVIGYEISRKNPGKEDAGVYENELVAKETENSDSSDVTYANGNYEITFVPGKLTIKPGSADKLGLTAEGFTGVYDAEKHTITVDYNKELTSETKISYSTDNVNWSDKLPEFEDATDAAQTVYVKAENKNYETATAQATVQISKRPVTVTAGNGTPQTFEFDNRPHTAEGITWTKDEGNGEGLLAKHTLKATLQNNVQTKVGSYEFTVAVGSVEITEGLLNKSVTNNYAITYAPGQMEIKSRKGTGNEYLLHIHADGATRVYNGEIQDVTIGYTVDQEINEKPTGFSAILNTVLELFGFKSSAAEGVGFTADGKDYTMSGITVSASGKNVSINDDGTSDYPFAATGTPVIETVIDGETVDVTDEFKIADYDLGYLSIDYAKAVVTAQDSTKTAGQKDKFTATVTTPENEALQPEAESTVKYTFNKKKLSGSKYEIIPTGDEIQGNFRVEYVNATQTVRPAPSDDDDIPSDPTPINDDPTPTAATPTGAVLGARREAAAATDGAAVLGARRGSTEDETNSTARVFGILVSAAAAISVMLLGRKKEEEEQ